MNTMTTKATVLTASIGLALAGAVTATSVAAADRVSILDDAIFETAESWKSHAKCTTNRLPLPLLAHLGPPTQPPEPRPRPPLQPPPTVTNSLVQLAAHQQPLLLDRT